MSKTYFSPERSVGRFFYIIGHTSDEFYTDGLMQLNIEQLVHLELKNSGYQRVIFLDKNNKLYTYDDESYSLNNSKGDSGLKNQVKPKSLMRSEHGLKNGRIGNNTTNSSGEMPNEKLEDGGRSEWIKGDASGINIKNIRSEKLHLGSSDDFMVSRKLEAYMDDKYIKTAIVINDPTSFLQDYGMTMHSFTTKYKRMLGPENENIIVFIYTDENEKNIFKVSEFESNDNKNINIIRINKPNSNEIKNMLMYLKYKKNLAFRMANLELLATSFHQAMGLGNIDITEAYKRLETFAKNHNDLTEELAYEILSVKKPKSAEEQLNNLIGMQSVKDALLGYKKIHVSDNKSGLTTSRIKPYEQKISDNEMIHFIITGRPGTGKTTVARLIGQLFYEMGYLSDGHVVNVGRSDLVAGYVGQTAIKTKEKIMEALGGVLFIDEAYSLTRGSSNDDGNGGDFGREAIDELVKAMTDFKGQFILVAAGYEHEMDEFLKSNPGLNGRFSNKLRIEDYTAEEIKEILLLDAEKKGYIFSEELKEELVDFCENWVNQSDENWCNAREAEILIDKIDKLWEKDSDRKEFDGKKIIEKKHFPDSTLENFRPVDEVRNEMLESINKLIGLNSVKDKIDRMRRNMYFGRQTIPGHYVFEGNPGTGKTTIARYMGRIMRNFRLLKRGHVVEYNAQDLISEYAHTHDGANKIFDKALDGVLFIDEAYQLNNNHIGEEILGSLLSFSINHEKDVCIVIAGYEDEMEQLLSSNSGLRSRFSEVIHFDNYSGIELYDILMDCLNQDNIRHDSDYDENAKRILVRYIPEKSKEKTFGNARYIKNEFIPSCEDKMYERLENKYGDSVDEDAVVLTGKDFPINLMKYTNTKIRDVSSENAMGKILKLEGFDEIKRTLQNMASIVEIAKKEGMPHLMDDISFHWVLKGNPGTGKTKIANLIGEVYKEFGLLKKGHVVVAKRQDLVAGYVGQTAIQTQNKINEAMGGILFIDEAYSLSRDDNAGADFGREAIDTILEQMSAHNGEFGVVAAGYPKEMEHFLKVNPGFRSRFGNVFDLPDYSYEDLAKIFVSMCDDKLFVVDEELRNHLPGIFEYTKKKTVEIWANAREAENLIRRMKEEWSSNPVTVENDEGKKMALLTLAHLPVEYKGFMDALNSQEIDAEMVLKSIDELIGFKDVKEKLHDFVNLVNAARIQNIPQLLDDLSFHWIIKGNPGTGKTTVAKLLGKVYRELGLLPKGHVVVARRQDLVAGYVGQTAIKTQKKIDEAIGGILFIDEAYTLADNHGTDSFGKEAIDTILEQMSSRNGEFGVVVAGYPGPMEKFLSANPGLRSRFDQEFVLNDYTADELFDIFVLKMQKDGFEMDDELTETLPTLFEVMIKMHIKNWANGREVENLLHKMKKEWSRNMLINVDENGKKHLFYSIKHLPSEYRAYLEKRSDIEKKEKEKKDMLENLASFSIARNALVFGDAIFDYDDEKENGFKKYRNSTVFIRCFSDDGEGQGSGSIISNNGMVLTCEHVIRNANKISVMLKNYDDKEVESSWHEAKVLWYDAKIDMAIILLDGNDFSALELSENSLDYKGGESIFMLGYPFGGRVNDSLTDMEASYFTGNIASKQMKEGQIRYLVGMEGKQGCSGAPVYSVKSGKIIGVFCGSQVQKGESITEEVNYFRPVSYIWERLIKEQEK